jgi:dTDP-4-amino-4,6-dideoxygalactose transaminase
VIGRGQFIIGPEIPFKEEELASFSSVAAVISCACGADALALALMAKNVGAK